MTDTGTKTITGWLLIDWKDGSHRTRQSKPRASELGANELLAKLKVNAEVPDVDVPTLAVDIDVPEPQVYAATLDALDDDELPDWTDAAVDVISNRQDDIHTAAPTGSDGGEGWYDLMASITLTAVQDAPGRPNVAHVRDFVEQMAMQMIEGDDLDPTDVDLGDDGGSGVGRNGGGA